MKAGVFHGIGDIRLDDVPEPEIREKTDAIVPLTVSAIRGTDLHAVRGTMAVMVPDTILWHEGVGIVEAVGPDVRNLKEGDRVVIPSSNACGYCSWGHGRAFLWRFPRRTGRVQAGKEAVQGVFPYVLRAISNKTGIEGGIRWIEENSSTN